MTTAVNPWLALPHGRPSADLTRRLRAAHEQLITGGLPRESTVRSIVRASWARALISGVDPEGGSPPVDLLDDDLSDYRAAHPLAQVMPVIRRLLVDNAEDDQMIVAVTDAAGRMLWVEGDHRLRSRAETVNFVAGSRWAEELVGTNAPGTALALDHAVQIYGSEHFRRPVQSWSCSAAPVHDPVSGAVLGAIDITGGDQVASPHVLTLVRATVAAVESELRWLHRDQLGHAEQPGGVPRRPAPPRPRPAPRLDVLGRERACLHLPGGPLELSQRHSELLLLLAEAAVLGEGRTAAQLAAECHPGDAVAVTVRAELSRLRRLVGPALLASRPYRLLERLDTDLDQLRRLLARGSVGSALDHYPGPVLPGSRAPGVVAARERARAAVRQAVLRSRRPELLLRYVQLAVARDDVVVWQACLEVLPPGSARRAAAAAHLLGLRRGTRSR